jgi:hypothetical protein
MGYSREYVCMIARGFRQPTWASTLPPVAKQFHYWGFRDKSGVPQLHNTKVSSAPGSTRCVPSIHRLVSGLNSFLDRDQALQYLYRHKGRDKDGKERDSNSASR